MPRHSWSLRRWGMPAEVTGLVVSGGGARASFHIGALRCLYERAGIAPTRLVGTSAGSIVSLMLAQSADPAGQLAQLQALERIWLSMTDPSDMFAEQAWFTRLRAQLDGLSGLTGLLGDGDRDGAPVVADDVDDASQLVQRAMEEDPSQDMTMTPAVLRQLAGSLLRVGRAGAGLAASVRGAERANSAYRPGPIVRRLLFESGFDAAKVASSGIELRLAFVDLNTGNLRFMRQDGVIVDRDDRVIDDTGYDLTLGVWASCAIPGVLRPVKIGDGVYVDGGVRDNVPVEMAVAHLGVTKPYVIAAAPADVAPDDYTSKDLVSVALRAGAIIFNETIQDEVEWARASGACVIEAITNVHDPATVEPALLHINRDYGWTRASEEVTGAPPSLRDVDEAIVKARCAWAAAVAAGDDDVVPELRDRLRDLLARADTALLPPGHETWADRLY